MRILILSRDVAMSLGEFGRIEKYFAPLTKNLSGAFALKDDAAELFFEGKTTRLVVTTDTIVESIHFIGAESPASIARKILATNLSDLAAKGASPHSYSLSLALPGHIDDTWIEGFASGLAEMQERYGFALSGGDSVKSPKGLVLTASFIGIAGQAGMIQRQNVEVDDLIYVTGTLGDGALGLLAARGEIQSDFLKDRYFHPRPRLEFLEALRKYAHAAMDISDGLVADATKMVGDIDASIEIQVARIPLSDDASALIKRNPEHYDKIFTGGDDYELLLAVKPDHVNAIESYCKSRALPLTRIGLVVKGYTDKVRILNEEGEPISFSHSGYTHS